MSTSRKASVLLIALVVLVIHGNLKLWRFPDQRLLILRSLREMAGYSANESILDSCLEEYGHSCSRDVVRNHIRWLEEQGLLTVDEVGKTLVAKLTGRGDDVSTRVLGQEVSNLLRLLGALDP